MDDKAESLNVAVDAISPATLESGDESSTVVSESQSRLEKLKGEHGVRCISLPSIN